MLIYHTRSLPPPNPSRPILPTCPTASTPRAGLPDAADPISTSGSEAATTVPAAHPICHPISSLKTSISLQEHHLVLTVFICVSGPLFTLDRNFGRRPRRRASQPKALSSSRALTSDIIDTNALSRLHTHLIRPDPGYQLVSS
jgi:hypothetical protein